MKRTDTSRRGRAQMKAWVYVALFGPGDDADETTDDPAPAAGASGDAADGDPPEE